MPNSRATRSPAGGANVRDSSVSAGDRRNRTGGDPSHDEPDFALRGALESLDLARWDELPEAQLPWDAVTDAARRQGISEADVIWDLAGKRKRTAA